MIDTAIGRKGSLLVFLLIASGANAETSVLDSVVQVVASKELPWFCHGIDCPEFTVDENFTAVANVERRTYSATKWVSKKVKGISYNKAVTDGFMSLFHYISGSNADGAKIPMTAPVRNRLIPAAGPTCENDFVISFFIPFSFQESTPEPTEEGVYLEEEEPFVVYVKTYGGYSSEKTVISNAADLAGSLMGAGIAIEEPFYFSASYDPPFRLFKRHNEVWVMEAGSSKQQLDQQRGAVANQK